MNTGTVDESTHTHDNRTLSTPNISSRTVAAVATEILSTSLSKELVMLVTL